MNQMAKKSDPFAKSAILPQGAAIIIDNMLSRLPASCLLCEGDASTPPLCEGCQNDLPQLPEARCPHCALPTPFGESCGSCLQQPPHFDAVISRFIYAFPADILIQALKYHARLALAPWFSRQLLLQPMQTAAIDCVIPLPLHPARLAERGFNQSAELGRHLAHALQCPLELDALIRNRPTPPQAQQPLKERHANVRGAFSCQRDLSGQHILLVDDVLTTGATANECARTLKLHGAARVTLAVVARALPHSLP